MHAPIPAETDSAKRESTSTTDQQKKKRKVESVAVAKKPAAQLEKWATKRQELKQQENIATATTVTETAEVSEFADLNQMCCLLCKRKFQSIEEIQKHERISKLHKVKTPLPPPSPQNLTYVQTNLADESLRTSVLEKL